MNKTWSMCPSLPLSLSLSLSVCFSHDLPYVCHNFALSISCPFYFFPCYPSTVSLFTISPFPSLPPDSRWVHCLPRRLTTHTQFSLIELRSLRTSALRFNLFWPEWGACTPSSCHFIKGTGWFHHGRGDRSDPERNHPNAPQQRAEYQTRYRVMVMGWKADWDFSKLIRPRERAGAVAVHRIASWRKIEWRVWSWGLG